MEYRQIGNTDIRASSIALGAWAIGGGPWWGPADDEESIRTIHAALDAGINLIDTAPLYGYGRSEEVLGKALKGRRDQAVIATKCGLWHQDERGSPFFEQDGFKVTRSLRPDTIRIEIEDSLKRLGVDCIDLYQTHWPAVEPDQTPIADTMACLLELKDQGKIRAIGASNVSTADMDAYRAVGALSVCQPRYSMLDRTAEAELLPYCLENQVSTLAYSPLEQGLLTGKIGMDRTLTDEEFRNMIPWFRPVNRQKVIDMLNGWKDLCETYACSTAQLVIAWTVAQPGLTCALCGARRVQNVLENAQAGDLTLQADSLARMRADVEALGAPVVEEDAG